MKDYMAEWKRNSIRIGAPTCIMAAFTAFIPVLYLCSRYGYQEIKPREALLACGDFGTGALAELDVILERVKEIL
jgi:hypothetical protein